MIDKKLLSRVKNNKFTLRHIPQAEIDKISNVNCILFLFWINKDNITLQNGYFRYTKDKKITIYKEIVYNHYDGFCYMPLFFLQCFEGFDYRQSLYLLNYYYYKISKDSVSKAFKEYIGTDKTETDNNQQKADLQYILKENLLNNPDEDISIKAYRKTYAYLMSRGFERFTIQNMISQKWLMIDTCYNLCFITYEDTNKNRVIAITKKGTGKTVYKCNYTAERNTGFFFAPKGTDNPTTLFIFESCLDLFSFVQLIWLKKISINEDFCCISLNGANNQKYIYKILGQYPNIKNVVCCLDNDYSGIQATKSIQRQITDNFYDLRPILKKLTDENNGKLIKDWNDALKLNDKINIDIEQMLRISKTD